MRKISNVFNNYFSSIGATVGSKIPPGRGSDRDFLNKRDHNKELSLNPPYSLFLNPSSPEEIEILIDSLDLRKSTGPTSIPIYLLKIYKNLFSVWLSKLANNSFETGIFPDLFKTAKITPIHKKESKLNHLNYRPISLLSVFSTLKNLFTVEFMIFWYKTIC